MARLTPIQTKRLLTAASFAVLVVVLCAASSQSAEAAAVKAKITSPRNNSTVDGAFTVRVRVHSMRGHFRIRYYVDGKLRATKRGNRTTRSIRKLKLKSVTPGTHRIRAVVSSRGQRSASSIKVNQIATGTTSTGPDSAPEKFRLIFNEDFTVPAARGTMGSDRDSNKVIYTGAANTKWVTYPKTFLDTYKKRPYRSDQVLSVHDGYLDYYLHPVDGQPAGANPSPLIDGASQYQKYGRYVARLKVDATDLSPYYIALLLWPKDEAAWASAESNFPEGPLVPGANGISAFSHFGPAQFELFFDPGFDIHEWHTYTQDWTPTQRRYYVDDKLIGVTRTAIYSGPERWQLQVETKGDGNQSGHVLIDWAAVYAL
jgi:hypothetical protein